MVFISKNKTLIIIIFVLVILSAIAITQLKTRESIIPFVASDNYEELTLQDGVQVLQTFETDTNQGKIKAIEVLMRLNNADNPSNIKASVIDRDNNTIGSTIVNYSSIQTYGDYVRIPVYAPPGNNKLQVILIPENFNGNKPISMFVNMGVQTGSLFVGDEKIDGALKIRIVYIRPISKGLVFFLAAIFVVLLFILIYFLIWRKKRKANEEHETDFCKTAAVYFVIAALLFGGLMALINPVTDTPDEPAHFSRAYYISTGHFSNPVKGEVSGIPSSLWQVIVQSRQEPLTLSKTISLYSHPITDSQQIANDSYELGMTGSYTFISYIPQSMGILFCRLFNLPVWAFIYIPRLFNLLAYVSIVGFAIYLTPRYKNVIIAVSLLAMSVFLAASYSQDALINAVFVMFLAVYLKNKISDQSSISGLVVMTLLLVVLILSKVTYCCFALLLLTLEYKHKKKSYLKYISFVILVAVTLVYYYFSVYTQQSATTYLPTISQDSGGQMQYILNSPFHFIALIVKNMFTNLDVYLGQLSTFGWLSYNTNILMPLTPIYLFLIYILSSGEAEFKPTSKLVIVLSILAKIFLISTALYLGFSGVASNSILGIQGRYFIPVLLLIPMLFTKKLTLIEEGELLSINISCTSIMLAYTLIIMLLRYY